MNSKSAKKTISKELTNYELADLLIKYIDGKFESTDKKVNLLALTMDKKFEASDKKLNLLTLIVDKKFAEVLMKIDRDIDEVGGMIARVFDKTATQRDIFNSESNIRGMFIDLNRRIDQMKFNHDQRITSLEDKLTIHKNLLEKNLKIKVPSR